jgi:hypothetical protein
VVNALIKANKYFDLLVMPGEEHGGGRRGPSAPYGDKKVWDFFARHLLDSPTPDWNTIKAPPARADSNPAGTFFGRSWHDVLSNWNGGGR